MFRLRKHQIRISSSSVTRITDLDDDTLVEIISRLSIKHMIVCKCVSKLWLRLISTICIPRITTSSPVYGLLFNTCGFFTKFKRGPWSFAPCIDAFNDKVTSPNTSLVESCLGRTLLFRPSPDDFLDCCNGLLLFFHPGLKRYYVYNPSTDQYVTIPNSPGNKDPMFGVLVFDPHYKVVHISWSPATMSIFSPDTCQWSVYNLNLEPSVIVESLWSPCGVFLDGSIYALSMSGHLLKFDVRHIGFRALQLPDIATGVMDLPMGCLGVSQGILHYSWSDKSSMARVWTLAQIGHTYEWVLKHTICLQNLDQHPVRNFLNLHDFSWFSVFAFHPTSDILFVGNLAGIFCYDPNTKRLENICRLNEDRVIFNRQCLVFPFSVNSTPLDPLKKFAGKKARRLFSDMVKE